MSSIDQNRRNNGIFSCFRSLPCVGYDLALVGGNGLPVERLASALLHSSSRVLSSTPKSTSFECLAIESLRRTLEAPLPVPRRVHLFSSLDQALATNMVIDHIALVVPVSIQPNLHALIQRWVAPELDKIAKIDCLLQRVTIVAMLNDGFEREAGDEIETQQGCPSYVPVFICQDTNQSRQLVAERLWRRASVGVGDSKHGASPLLLLPTSTIDEERTG